MEVKQKKVASPKLIVIGYARSGKDTLCEELKRYGYSFLSSSWFACEKVVFPVLAEKYDYQTVKECFDDRLNHRQEWFELIKDFNTPDLDRLGQLILGQADIYCGLRRQQELKVLQRRTNAVTVWVEAGSRIPPEPAHSCTVSADMADVIVHNRGDVKEYLTNIELLFEALNDERTVITSNQSTVIEIDGSIVCRGRVK